MLKNPLYGQNSLDNSSLIQTLSGLSPIKLAADTTLAIANHSVQVGSYVEVNADAKTLTLPAASGAVGASFIVVNTNDDAGGLLTISPNSSDKFLIDIAGAAGTDNKDILNTKASQKKYDFVHLICISDVGWYIHNIRGIWVDES